MLFVCSISVLSVLPSVNFSALFSTSSGDNVSNISVSCKSAFPVFEMKRSLTILSSTVSKTDHAACTVSAAWKDSSLSPVF